VVDGSVVHILHDSVAKGESEEFLTISVGERLDVIGLGFSHFGALGFLLVVGKMSENGVLLDLLVLEEKVEGGLSDWDDLLHNVPEDSLGEWGGGQGSWICPSSVEAELGNELCHVNLLPDLVGNHGVEESIVEVISIVGHEVVILDSFEQESQDTVGELRLSFSAGKFWLKLMDNVHFQIHELSIDAVLRWTVEVSLQTVEGSLLDVLVEEVDG